jgi:Ca2+-binding RTX toxin-like protein
MTRLVSNSTELRTAIQAAKGTSFTPGAVGDPIIELTGTGSFSSAVTLGKRSSTNPAPFAYTGYTIQGASSSLATSATLQDTQIYQQNTDSAFLPGTVQNLTLNYSSSSNGKPLLSIDPKGAQTPTQSLTIKNVDFTGTTTGWTSNGNLYMSLRSFSNTNPLKTTFTLDNVNVSIKGQNNGFTTSPTTGGSAFFHNWNNSGVVTIKDSTFDEGGFRSSFNFYNTGALASTPTNVISGNTFKRTTSANVRDQGNLLGNVTATLTSNTFQDGAYVDLYGNMSGITFAGKAIPSGSPTTPNTFATIAGGYGIRVTETPGSGIAARSGSPVFTGQNKFTGSGLALKYVNSAAYLNATPSTHGNLVNVSNTANDATAFEVEHNGASRTYQRLIASGQNNDSVIFSGAANNAINTWISGDDGNDTLVSANANDCLLGGSGNDSLTGNNGLDILDGGSGNDSLIGGSGNDTLIGGAGADQFYYTNNQESDIITDFSRTDLDQMRLGDVSFASTTTGQTLNTGAYQTLSSLTSAAILNNRVTELTFNYSKASALLFTTTTLQKGYLLFFDSSSSTSWLFYDTDWRDTSGRQAAMELTNITTLSALTAFDQNQFRMQ